MKHLIPVSFTTVKDQSTSSGESKICPSCKKGLSNTVRIYRASQSYFSCYPLTQLQSWNLVTTSSARHVPIHSYSHRPSVSSAMPSFLLENLKPIQTLKTNPKRTRRRPTRMWLNWIEKGPGLRAVGGLKLTKLVLLSRVKQDRLLIIVALTQILVPTFIEYSFYSWPVANNPRSQLVSLKDSCSLMSTDARHTQLSSQDEFI